MSNAWCDVGPEGHLYGPVSVTANTPWPCKNGYPTGFQSPARGLVIHTEDGYEQGTISWFNNPDAEASATFAVDSNGAVWQFGPVGHGWCSWAQSAGNATWYSVEDADGTHPSVPFTAAQVHSLALIAEALSWHDGFPLVACTDPLAAGTKGITLHSEGGVPFGDHPECPGPVRGAQRIDILAAAKTIRSQREAPIVTITSWKSDGSISLAELAERRKTAVSSILRVTGGHGLFDAPTAKYIDDVFAGAIPPSTPVPAGSVLWVPA